MYIVNYCTTAGLSVLFLVGCLVHLNENDVFSIKTIKKFRKLIYVLMSEIVLDCFFKLLEGHGVENVVLYVIKFTELFLNPVLGFLVFDVFYEKKWKREWGEEQRLNKPMTRVRNLTISFIIANGVLLTLAVLGWNVFSIDEANLYHRGPLVVFYLSILGAMIITLIYGIILVSNKTQSSMRTTLFFFATILILGIVLRIILPDTNFDFLCMSVSISFLLIYYAHVTLRLDPLTKLLNRQVYMRLLERIDYATIVIMIDANNFKHINDTHGHECGDRTLKQLAKLIRKAYEKYAYCFRIGGDEFCAILKPGVFERLIEETPHFDARILADKLTNKLDDLISQAKNTDNNRVHLEYGVSQGYGVFYQPETRFTISLDGRKSFREIVEIADGNMYKNKEKAKEQLP